MKRLALLAVLTVVGIPAAADALPPPCGISACVRLTPEGPVPRVIEVWPGQTVWFASAAPTEPTTVRIDGTACAPVFAPQSISGCGLRTPGEHRYTVTGFGAGEGTIVVRHADWVTLRPARAVVVYGRRVRLTGSIYFPPHDGPPPPPSHLVAVEGLPASGAAISTPVEVAETRRLTFAPSYLDWSTVVRPRISTAYVAVWRRERSSPAQIDVRPHVTLRRTRGRAAVAVRPAAPWAGRHVVLQRLRDDGSWEDVSRARLDARATAIVRAPAGSTVRAYADAAAGYVAGWSAPLAGLSP